MENNKKICFILVAGFAPDNLPVLALKKSLEEKGFSSVASGFFGQGEVIDFQSLDASSCVKNISQLIDEAKLSYGRVFGIGISLGGAFLLEYAKKNNSLDGIVSIGTPFRLKNMQPIKLAKILFPFFYPVWKRMQRVKRWRLLPLGAGIMMVDYLQNSFIADLETVNTPILFMHSKNDGVTDYRAVEEFSKLISSAKKRNIFLDNGSHVIDDDPELIISHALDFFDISNIEESKFLEDMDVQSAGDLAFAYEKHEE